MSFTLKNHSFQKEVLQRTENVYQVYDCQRPLEKFNQTMYDLTFSVRIERRTQ